MVQVTPFGMSHHHEGLGATPRTDLQACPLTGGDCRDQLCVVVRGHQITPVKGAGTNESSHTVDAHGTRKAQRGGTVLLKRFRHGIGAQRVHVYGYGRRLKLGIQHILCASFTQGVHDPAHEPHGQSGTARAGYRLAMILGNVLGAQKRESVLAHASQHGVGESGGSARDAPNELNALTYHDLGRGIEIQGLKGGDA